MCVEYFWIMFARRVDDSPLPTMVDKQALAVKMRDKMRFARIVAMLIEHIVLESLEHGARSTARAHGKGSCYNPSCWLAACGG